MQQLNSILTMSKFYPSLPSKFFLLGLDLVSWLANLAFEDLAINDEFFPLQPTGKAEDSGYVLNISPIDMLIWKTK